MSTLTINGGKKRLVILGAGLGGLPLALRIEGDKKLASKLDVVLVDKKDYYEINLASVRYLILDNFNNFSAPISTFLKTARFVKGEVRVVQANPQQVDVLTDQGEEAIPYDYLVIALGSRYALFKAASPSREERNQEVSNFAQQLRNANRVLIVGGRSVGVEIAGEILEHHPEKQVTIVHAGPSLMDVWPKSGVTKLNKFLASKNRTTVILNKKVVQSEGNRHQLDDGSVVEADIKILATGMIPNSEALRQNFASSLTAAGLLKVDKTLQVQGHQNIFAFGDIADLDAPKMAANLKGQIDTLLKNLHSTLQNKKKLAPVGAPMMQFPGLVTLGPSNAILALPIMGGSSFSGKYLANMKGGLFAKMVKNPLG